MSLLNANDGEEAAYTDIADAIRMHSAQPTQDLHELWRRAVFSVLVGNLDDHLRNHGFLWLDDGWRLSPAYDLNPEPAETRAREMTTWISEESPEANVQIALNACEFFALTRDEADRIVEEVSDAVVGWEDTAQKLGMSAPDRRAYRSAFQV
jgi:serine/threonine-protein kinase HipA